VLLEVAFSVDRQLAAQRRESRLPEFRDQQLLTLWLVTSFDPQPKQRMQFKELLSHPGIQLVFAETKAMEA
jgi:hypothetical protein